MTLLGSTIGHIRLVDHLGKGGMGQVFVGYDDKLKRKVAVKIIRGERRLDGRAKKRFEREAQVLSQLNHPSICQIYDYIEEKDNDYLILELIQGSDFTNAKQLNIKDKLAIAEDLARVLITTHNKGIVHRDLKPDNILLTHENRVKVLDFGLSSTGASPWAATLTESDLDQIAPEERSQILNTQLGTVLGTLRYMSPEQARGESATAASDMYSLGLVLQEMLTGSGPYPSELTQEALLWRAINGDTLPVTGLTGDLLQLINRLKSPVADIRPTAVETAERLRWIRQAPQRRTKRNIILTIVTLLIVGILGTGAGLFKAKAEAMRANQEADNAKQTIALMKQFLSSVDPGRQGKDIKVSELLDAFRPKLDELNDTPRIQASLYLTFANTYNGLGLYEQSIECAEKSLSLRRTLFGDDHRDTLDSLNTLGVSLADQGTYQEAETVHRQCLQQRAKLLGNDHPQTVQSLSNLANTLGQLGRHERATSLHLQCLKTRRRILGDLHPDTIASMINVAAAMSAEGRYAEAEALEREYLLAAKRAFGNEHPDTLTILHNLGHSLVTQGKLEEAEPYLQECLEVGQRVLGKEHPRSIQYLHSFGRLLHGQEKYEEPEDVFRRSLALRIRVVGVPDSETADSMNDLAVCLSKQGKYAEAVPLLRQCLATRKQVFGEDHRFTFAVWSNLSSLLVHLAAYDEAAVIQRQWLDVKIRVLGESHPDVAVLMYDLGCLASLRGKQKEALRYLRNAIDIGFSNKWIAEDPDLEALHGDPEFEDMVAEVHRKSEDATGP